MTSAAKVGIVMLIALAVLGYFVLRIEDISLNRSRTTREVKAIFDDVAGLDDESAVRIAGVRKGHVTNIRVLPDGRAEVTMQVDDDVPLHSNAHAKVANLGLLGEKYIELEPGSAQAPVLPAGDITLRGVQPASFDDITEQVSTIAEDVKAITASMRQVMGGESGQQRLEEIVENVRLVTADMRLLVASNRANIDATLGNAREITAQLRVEIPRLADSIDAVARQMGGTVGENREDVRDVVQNLRGLSKDLRVTADNLNDITGQVRTGEGSVGKLLYSDEAHERLTSALTSVEGGVKSLQETLGRANRIQMDLGIRGDYMVGLSDNREINGVKTEYGSSANTRSSVGIKIQPNPDINRFFNIEFNDDPRGKRKDKVVVETITNPATGRSETIVTETQKYESDLLFSGQVGWQLDPALAVRVGVFDNTGGIGADYRFNDRLVVTGEAFDFGERRDDNAHVRLFGEYTIRKERKHTPRLFVTTGVDNALNDSAFTFGGGVRWRDEDLKYLLGSIPLGN